jgi:hypothetical protein
MMKRNIRGVTKRPPEAEPELPQHVLDAMPCARGPVEGFYFVWQQAFETLVKQHNNRWVTGQCWQDRQGVRHEMIIDSGKNIMAYCAIPRGGLDPENGTYTIRQDVWERTTSFDF